MLYKNTQIYNKIVVISFFSGFFGLFLVLILDKLLFKKGIISEGWPNYSIGYLIRSLIIFISVLILFFGAIERKKYQFILFETKGISIELLSIIIVLCISLFFIYIFLFKPSLFSILCLEDGLIEWSSALLLFGSCIIFFLILMKNYKNLQISKRTTISLALIALVFFIIGMEEVSWFQRVLNIKTPEIFKSSLQSEINLHNIKTDYFENAYYFGSFVYLVLLPFFRFIIPDLFSTNYLKLFIARPFITIIGSMAFAYNFDMWNIIYSQISFFGSGIILFYFSIINRIKREKYIILFTFYVFIITQVLFLSHGENFSRLWDVTEYKEFLIPLVFFVYSLDVFHYFNRVFLN
ncbi:MAG: hypothetical protein ACXWTP_03690 [Methylosarcina sp.]